MAMIKPSQHEFKLLRALWRSGRLSGREIHDATVSETEWSYSTTRKTLDRMVDKGLIQIQPVHGLIVYVARQTKLETLAFLVSKFASDVLDLNTPLPAATFANSRLIAPEEVEELERLLEQMAGRTREDGIT